MKLSRMALLATLAVALPAAAHHGRIGLFSDERIQIEGTVSRFDWRNPHVYVFVETVDAEGRTVQWMFENTSVSTMTRQGWTRDTLRVGDRITVEARPHADPAKQHGSSASYLRPDGRLIGRPNSEIRGELFDPEYMAEPFRDSRRWKYAPDLEPPEPGNCSEEVGGRWLQ